MRKIFVFMSLCFISGPSWEEDTLNEIQEESVQFNAEDMLRFRVPWFAQDLGRESFLPNVNSTNLEYNVKNN